jgi:signal transduction histidine kinase
MTELSIPYQAALLTAAALVIIGGYLLFSIVRHRRKFILLRAHYKFEEIKAVEQERIQIALDLHDSVTPLLSAVKIAISSIRIEAEDQPVMDRATAHIDDIIRDIRMIGNELVPQLLLRYGVSSAITHFIETLREQADIDIQFEGQGIPRLSADIAINLYRIIMEIIHHTLKHSWARSLFIRLATNRKQLVLTSSDDGVGFDLNKTVHTRRGRGLLSLQNRTELLNGSLQLESKPDRADPDGSPAFRFQGDRRSHRRPSADGRRGDPTA